MPSDASIKPAKSSKSQHKKNRAASGSISSGGVTPEYASSNSTRSSASTMPDTKAKNSPSKRSRRLSAQSMRYDETDGVIKVRDIEGTALDSDEYYEYLYEDLIDAEGAPASKLVSKETVKISFEDDKNDNICTACQVRFADCPHINPAGVETSHVEQPAKAKSKTKRKKSST